MNWKIYISDRAEKQLKKFPKNDFERIKKAVDEMESEPFGGDVGKLSGQESVWRRRVGSYRIFYEINISRKIIYIFDIKRRTSSSY